MRDEFEAALEAAWEAARAYLSSVDEMHVGAAGAEFDPTVPLPHEGIGAARALADLVERASSRAHASSGPRYFHFVVGGVTPAALGADWLTSTWDQIASSSAGSPLAVELEELVMRWLAELFGLDPSARTGVLTSGATMANFVGLGAARQWWGAQHGVDVAEDGLHGTPRLPVLTSGLVHASVVKALAMLGIGRSAIERFEQDNRGTLDVDALDERLARLDGSPAIVVATAGDVNAGRFDPLARIVALAERYPIWVHVDAAFGLFAGVSPRTAHFLEGAECMDSIASDGHKWMNVPYDCGFAFVRDRALLAKTFRMTGAYLTMGQHDDASTPDRARVCVPANLTPEASRRARALPLFATLLANGRDGVRAMVEKHLDLAQYLVQRVRESSDLELVDGVCLNIVPFRCAPKGVRRRDLDALNGRVGAALLKEGRVYAGLTRYRSVVCFRPAIANWRTSEQDIDLLVDRVLELSAVGRARER